MDWRSDAPCGARGGEMMRPQLFALGIAAILCLPSTAAAQRRMPHAGAGALGIEGAVFVPKQGDMSAGPDIGGFYEHYLSARNGLRVGAEWSNPRREIAHDDSVRQIRLGA